MNELRDKSMGQSGEELTRKLAEVKKDATAESKDKEDVMMISVQAEEKEREESKSEAVKEQKQVEVKDDLPTRSGQIDTSRVDKPAVQEEVVMPKELSTAPAMAKETPTEEDPAPPGKTVNDEAAEACETAAKPIEQASKRVSSSVRLVGSELKVFISHCKKKPGTEDRAIWIADVLDSREADSNTQLTLPTNYTV